MNIFYNAEDADTRQRIWSVLLEKKFVYGAMPTPLTTEQLYDSIQNISDDYERLIKLVSIIKKWNRSEK